MTAFRKSIYFCTAPIQDWVEYYQDLKIWVYPSNMRFNWLDWRNLNDDGYLEKAKSFIWNDDSNICLITGKKGICCFGFDEDDEWTANTYLRKVLDILQLPKDYDWVIKENDSYLIIIDICNTPKGSIDKEYRDFRLYYEDVVYLPKPYGNINFKIRHKYPMYHPQQIQWQSFKEGLDRIDKIFKDKGVLTQEEIDRKKYEKKMTMIAILIGIPIVVGVFTAIVFLFSGKDVNADTFFIAWIVTSIALMALVVTMSGK